MKRLYKILPALSAVLCAACLVLLLLDIIKPDWSLFLSPAVKWFLLVCCISVIAGSGALIAKERKRIRRRRRK